MKGEQFDFFKKPAGESSESEHKQSEGFTPGDEDIEFAIGEFEEGGRPITLFDAKEQARKNREEFRRAKEKLKKIFEEKGTQKELLED